MNSYTIFIIHEWGKHGDDIKKIFHKYNLKWNSAKIVNLSHEDLKNILKKFQIVNDFRVRIDELNKNVSISSGVWENEDVSIKIIKIENDDDVILIHKGDEEKLYSEFIEKCKYISPLIKKIIDDRIIFERRINVKMIEKLNNKEAEKKVKIKNFITKTELMEGLSDEFKRKWIKCIEDS